MEATLGPAVLVKVGVQTLCTKPSDGLEGGVIKEFCEGLRKQLGNDLEVYEGPGMCSATSSKPEIVNRFFVSSADFWVQRPWDTVDSTATFVLHFPSSKASRYFVVLGKNEADRGLLMAYSDVDLILMHKKYRDGQRKEDERAPQPNPSGLRPSHRTPVAAIFKPIERIPFDVVEEIDRYDWVTHERVPFVMDYPEHRPRVMDEDGQLLDDFPDVLRPTTIKDDELKFLDIAMRALPKVIAERFKGDQSPPPFRHLCDISTGEEMMQILIRHKPVASFDFELSTFDVNNIFADKQEGT